MIYNLGCHHEDKIYCWLCRNFKASIYQCACPMCYLPVRVPISFISLIHLYSSVLEAEVICFSALFELRLCSKGRVRAIFSICLKTELLQRLQYSPTRGPFHHITPLYLWAPLQVINAYQNTRSTYYKWVYY